MRGLAEMAWQSSGGYPGVVSDTNDGLIVGDVGLGQYSHLRRNGDMGGRVVTGAELVSQGDLAVLRDGSLGRGIGLFGHSAPSAATTGGAHTAGGTYTSTEQAMLEAVYTALQSIGLVT